MISPRKQFITLLKSKEKEQSETQRQLPIHKNPIQLRNKHNTSEPKHHFHTERNKTQKKIQPIHRKSTNNIEKFIDWKSKVIKSKNDHGNSQEKILSLKKYISDNSLSTNKKDTSRCRIVILNFGKSQQQYFLEINKTSELLDFLTKMHPKVQYFKTVPRQLSIEYLLTQKQVSGQFLNGQSIYFKPQIQMKFNEQITFQHFQILKLIGSGGFAKVFLCRCKLDNNFYALKLIDKEMILRNKKQGIIMNERNIMEEGNHPFLISMKFAFQTEKYLIFIVEYCAGGELFGLIKKYRRLNENMARFYIIQILLGLEYLHKKNVVYRDIKPENILLDLDGHVKIADLGLAKPKMHEGVLAHSFCGSPQYMSPQMILQIGHTYPVDYYCMGVLLYELLIGLPPFYSQNPNEIYEAVLEDELTFPKDLFLSAECRNLLEGLLCKESKKRLGSLHGIKQILAHPWFGKKVYQDYLDKKIQPPINFKNIKKICLDEEETQKRDANKEILEKVLKHQKFEKRQFKRVMNLFQFDYRYQRISYNEPIIVSPFNKKQILSCMREKENRQNRVTKKLSKRHIKTVLSPGPITKILKK